MTSHTNKSGPRGKASSGAAGKDRDLQRFRVEGLARRGRVLYAHIVGRPGTWTFYGSAGFRLEVKAGTVNDAVRIARKKLPFRPIALRSVES